MPLKWTCPPVGSMVERFTYHNFHPSDGAPGLAIEVKRAESGYLLPVNANEFPQCALDALPQILG